MEGNSKEASATPIVAGTIEVRPGSDPRHLIGDCPTCGNRLRVDVNREDSTRGMVACLRCRELYRIRAERSFPAPAEGAVGFGVAYTVEGPWDPLAILEHLFDTVGSVEYVPGGFVCHPDEGEAHLPTILIDEHARIIRLGLFGPDTESEAAAVINQAVSELASRFQLVLSPVALDRWAFREDTAGLALIDRRPLGTFMRESFRRQAHT